MFCVNGATERLLCIFWLNGAIERLEPALCGCLQQRDESMFWMVELRDLCKFCVDRAIETLL